MLHRPACSLLLKRRGRGSMANKISIENLSEAIAKELEGYSQSVDEAMQKAVNDTAKEVVKSLANDESIPKRTGKYKESFMVKKIAQGSGYVRLKIANKIGQITHLLEYGHVTSNGKRTKAFPHWRKAEKRANELLPQKLKEGVESIDLK